MQITRHVPASWSQRKGCEFIACQDDRTEGGTEFTARLSPTHSRDGGRKASLPSIPRLHLSVWSWDR